LVFGVVFIFSLIFKEFLVWCLFSILVLFFFEGDDLCVYFFACFCLGK
jgi:hypothetical protein